MNPQEERAYLAARPQAIANATGPIEIHGNPGWEFSIRGSGFGSAGSLTIGGIAIACDRWDNENGRGSLPSGAKGAIVLIPARGKLLRAADPNNDRPAEYAPAPPARKGVYDEDGRRAAADKAFTEQAAADRAERLAVMHVAPQAAPPSALHAAPQPITQPKSA